MSYERFFKEDEEGNVVYFPHSFWGRGYTLTPSAKQALLGFHMQVSILRFVYVTVYAGLLLVLAHFGVLALSLFWLLLLGPALPIALHLRRLGRRHWADLPVSEARLTYRDVVLPGLVRDPVAYLVLIVVGTFLFLTGVFSLASRIGVAQPRDEFYLSLGFAVFGLGGAACGFYLRRLVRRAQREGQLEG